MNPEELAYNAAGEWKKRALNAEAQLDVIRTENRKLCMLCADMRAWRDRVRLEFWKLQQYYDKVCRETACPEVPCEFIESLEEAIRS